MPSKSKSLVCTAALLLVWLGLAVAQEPQPPKNESQPEASSPKQPSPEKAAPQTTEPQGTEPQPVAPSPAKPDAQAPKEQTTPAPQEQPPATVPAAPQQQAPSVHSKPHPARTASSKKAPTKAKKTSRKTSATRSRASQAQKTGTAQPDKVVVRNGSVKDSSVLLSPALSQEQNSHDRKNTDQLLATTDGNLKRMEGRQLTASQQSTIDQIRSYMRQAKLAADAGDPARAHTLASKAHLLSDDLAKP